MDADKSVKFPCLTRDTLGDVADHLAKHQFFWLDIDTPTPDELDKLGELLHLHPLTVQDVSTFSERPKREHYDGYVSLVIYGVDADTKPGDSLLREVHLLISGDYVVTLHPHPFAVLDQVHQWVTQEGVHGEQALIYRILDGVLGTYVPVLTRIDDEIDEIEEAVIASPSEDSLRRIFALKRDLIGMRRVVTPMRDFFARDAEEITHLPGMEQDQSLYFRDLYDSLVRTSDLVDSYRDLLSGAADLYLSTVANRQGEVGKQLAMIATIFLPLSFLTGFFGQNFAFLTNHIQDSTWSFFVLGLGLLVVSIVILIVFFRRKGWLNPAD
jgi:magnesium transporter